jgi:hypothetical protein
MIEYMRRGYSKGTANAHLWVSKRGSPGQHARLWVSRCLLKKRRSSIVDFFESQFYEVHVQVCDDDVFYVFLQKQK